MRSRLALALVALSLPAAELSAQRRPVVPPQTSRRPRPAEKPPQAPGIPDARLYSRYKMSRFSVESYPMLTYLQTTGYVNDGFQANWLMLGDGTHIGFRISPSLGMTADMTSAVMGGPFSLGAADVGLRFKPWPSNRFVPIIDARTSWAYTVGNHHGANAVPLVLPTLSMFGISTGSGRGSMIGVGMETTVRRKLVLSTTLSATHYRMTSRNFSGGFAETRYTADALRFAVGLRYNPGRWLD